MSQNSVCQSPCAQAFDLEDKSHAVLLTAAVCLGLRVLCFLHVSGSWVARGGGFLSGKNKFIGVGEKEQALRVSLLFSQTKRVGFGGKSKRLGSGS